jgi:NADPH:quinone reductase-like Zn-dependent oxidoreductase
VIARARTGFGEVLVKIHRSGVNPSDVKSRKADLEW